MNSPRQMIPSLQKSEEIQAKIYTIRGLNVMLDRDLAELYGVSTGNLNKAVKRNVARFPEDFRFQLTGEELENLRFQIGIANISPKSRSNPYVFTQEGVAMLSSVLRSQKAIAINVQIMRTFVAIRRYGLTNTELAERIDRAEAATREKFKEVYAALKYLIGEIDPHTRYL